MASGWPTAAEVVNRTARRMGLTVADVADPFGSSDPNVQQLAALLSDVGEELARSHRWSHLKKTATFTTVAATEDYATPADYQRLLDGTAWNRTTDQPLIGPASEVEWQALKARDQAAVISKVFRVYQDKIWLHPVPTAAEQVAYEYLSAHWVTETGQAAPNAAFCDAATDTLHFDPHLLVCALSLAWEGAKKMDTGRSQARFDLALARAMSQDGAAAVHTQSTADRGFRPLGYANLPDTGYGS